MANELKIIVKFDTGKASAETKQYAEGSVGYLEQQLKKLRLAYKELTVGTEEQRQALVKLKQIEAEVNDVRGRGITVTKNSNSASANATVTLQALNYTVRDSAYFARDFSLGMLAVGNNLNPLIDGFIRMRQETGSYKGATSALLSTLIGPAGLMFAFSIIVTAIQAITFELAKNKSEAKTSAETISQLAEEYRTLSEKLQQAKKEALNLNADDVNAAVKGLNEQLLQQIKYYDELIAKKGMYLGLATGQSLTGQGYGSISSALFAPTKEDLQNARDKKQITQEQIDAYSVMGTKIGYIIDTYFSGDKKNALALFGGLSRNDQALVNKAIKEYGDQIESNVSKQFEYAGTQINLTKDRAKELTDIFNELLHPKEEKKSGLYTQLYEINELVADIFEKNQRYWDAILNGVNDKNINALGLSRFSDKNPFGIFPNMFQGTSYNPLDKVEEGRNATQILQDSLKSLSKENQTLIGLTNQVGDTIFQAFLHGKTGVDELIASVLILMGKFLLIQTITAGLASLLPTPVAGALGSIRPEVPNTPYNAPISPSADIQKSIQAMNANMVTMSQPIYIISDVPGQKFTREVTQPNIERLKRSNVNYVR